MNETTDQPALADPTAGGDEGHSAAHHAQQKRSRILLSCAPCRLSKLKCDRSVPCNNCLKKDRADQCAYAPRPKKPEKQNKGMAARLRRLEGMLREIIADDGSAAMSSFGEARYPGAPARATPAQQLAAEGILLEGMGTGTAGTTGAAGAAGTADAAEAAELSAADSNTRSGRVVMGARSTTYIGATHFMAMLDDIEDLRTYFEDAPDGLAEAVSDEPLEDDSPESMMLGVRRVRSKYDLLAMMPPKGVVDQLIISYFGSNTPSVHTVHRPTFAREYSTFWQDPAAAEVDWLGVLFGIMALGVHFQSLTHDDAPEAAQTFLPLAEQFKLYRSATSWALTTRRLTKPNQRTIQALLMFEEAEFLVNRASQTHCWLLSAVCVRLMLRMGMHRDPSRLPNLSVFDGEMRRRMWNLAIQLDLIVSFHMGLPSMIHGIPSDTSLPHNLLDEDFGPDAAVLPPPRPDSEYTSMSYPIFKSIVCRVFGQVARLSHTLTPPSYAEVLRTDALLLDKWRQIPGFLKVRPLSESVLDPTMQIVQRFGLASLFQKSRCVLHRPYLAVTVPRPEHAYSRRTCLQAALELLSYHDAISEATWPGGILRHIGWFVTGLGMHDFLLAAMIVYLVVQNEALFAGELITADGGPAEQADHDWERTAPAVGMAAAAAAATGAAMTTSSGYSGSSGMTGLTGLTGSSGTADSGTNSSAGTGTRTRTHTGTHTGTGTGTGSPHAQLAPSLPIAKSALIELLLRSYRIWASVATNHHEVQKAAELLRLMVSRIEARSQPSSDWPADMPPVSNMSLQDAIPTVYETPLDLSTPALENPQTTFSRRDLVPAMASDTAGPSLAAATGAYDSWIPLSLESLDWETVDNGLRASSSHPTDWIDQSTVDDIQYLTSGLWDHPDGVL